MNLERQTRKKVKKLNDGTSDDNDNGGGGNTLTNNIFVVGELHPPASASPHLLAGLETQVLQAGGVRADATSLRDQQKEGNTFPKGPTSQNSTKMYLEEETGNDIFFEDFAESLLTVFPEGVDRVSSWEEIPMMNEELSENHEVIELKREMAIKHLDRTFHYHDLNHDSEQTQKIADDTKTQNVAHDINLPIIRSQFPIGQRVDIEKRYQESIAQICGMFLSLYFGIVHKSGDVEMTKKTFAFQVAEEEKLIPGNNFQQLVLEDTRIFAILLIAAVRLSEEISMKKSLR